MAIPKSVFCVLLVSGGVNLAGGCSRTPNAVVAPTPKLSAIGQQLLDIANGKTALVPGSFSFPEDTPEGQAVVAAQLKTAFRLKDAEAARFAAQLKLSWRESTRTPKQLIDDLAMFAGAGLTARESALSATAVGDFAAGTSDEAADGLAGFIVSQAMKKSESARSLLDGARKHGFSDEQIAAAFAVEKQVAKGVTVDKAINEFTWPKKQSVMVIHQLVSLRFDGGVGKPLGKLSQEVAATSKIYTVPGLGRVTLRRRASAQAWSVVVADIAAQPSRFVEGGKLEAEWNSKDEAKTTWFDLKTFAAPGVLVSKTEAGNVTIQSAAWAEGNMWVKPYLCESGQVSGVTLMPKTELITECVDQVKARLKAPSQAEFPGRVMDASAYEKWTNADCNQVVTSTVDAPNAFGVKMRQTWQCLYRPTSKTYQVTFRE